MNCIENNWDLVGGVYPASNSCGQLGQDYSSYQCSEAEQEMECPVDPNMQKTAATNAKWVSWSEMNLFLKIVGTNYERQYGAPGPMFW